MAVEIDDVAPGLRVAGSQETCTGQALDLANLGVFTHAPVATGNFSYTIDWGDGTTPDTGSTDGTGTNGSTAQIVDPGSDSAPLVGTLGGQHTYSAAGNYYVAVTVTDPDGLSNTQTMEVAVDASAPVASPSPADQSGPAQQDTQPALGSPSPADSQPAARAIPKRASRPIPRYWRPSARRW